MADESDVPVASEGSAGKWILLALAVIYVAGSLYFIFDLRGRLDKMGKDQAASSAQVADLGKRMQSAEADDETLATQLGMTKKEMATRSAELMRQQKASEARLSIKGAKPQPVSTVALQLKKTDLKKGKFTLNVTSDDKTIEKKDRNVSEPIQFYSGRDRMLYELVVWTVDKNKATGYLSTPKGAPTPITATQ